LYTVTEWSRPIKRVLPAIKARKGKGFLGKNLQNRLSEVDRVSPAGKHPWQHLVFRTGDSLAQFGENREKILSL
jgi:hypothetical protein